MRWGGGREGMWMREIGDEIGIIGYGDARGWGIDLHGSKLCTCMEIDD